MVYFQIKNTNLGKFWRALEWKMLVYFMFIWNIWYILWPFGNVVVIWYIFPRFGIFCVEKIWQPRLRLTFLPLNKSNQEIEVAFRDKIRDNCARFPRKQCQGLLTISNRRLWMNGSIVSDLFIYIHCLKIPYHWTTPLRLFSDSSIHFFLLLLQPFYQLFFLD
jgi:hypothetical protein